MGVLARVSQRKFLRAVQSRAARAAVTASATRGQGKDVVKKARGHLVHLNLARFGVSASRFSKVLDRETDRLMEILPSKSRRWGLARKLLNIFLRDCFYTTYLQEAYRLDESALELPLDSISVTCLKKAWRLKKDAKPALLPRWRGVKHLEQEDSDKYQAAARELAISTGRSRVHLDAEWWSASRDAPAR